MHLSWTIPAEKTISLTVIECNLGALDEQPVVEVERILLDMDIATLGVA